MDEKEQKRIAEAVQATLSTQGWRYLDEYLTDEMNKLLAQLIKEDDQYRMRDLQRDVRSLKNLMNKIAHYAEIQV